jgi:hypothetical protein
MTGGRHLRGVGLLAAVVGVVAIGLFAQAAFADPPVRVPPAPVPDFTVPDSCAFPVLVHTDTNKEVTTVFSNGRVLVTGALKGTLTNLDDPTKSIQVNIPGPGTFTATADGGSLLTASGPWLIFFSPDQLGPGTPGQMILTTGLFTLLTNPDGSQVFTHTTGTTTDVCTLLA